MIVQQLMKRFSEKICFVSCAFCKLFVLRGWRAPSGDSFAEDRDSVFEMGVSLWPVHGCGTVDRLACVVLLALNCVDSND